MADVGRQHSAAVVADRYRLGAVLGRGSSATVYRGWDQLLHREVAVKVFPPEEEGGSGWARRWRREVGALAALYSPHVVSIYDGGQLDDRGFVVMQLVEGATLAAELHRGRWSVLATAALLLALARGVEHLHRHGVVHGDVGPHSVLLERHQRPWLCGFTAVAPMPEAPALAGEDDLRGLASIATACLRGRAAPADPAAGAPADAPADIRAQGPVDAGLLEALRALTISQPVPTDSSHDPSDHGPAERVAQGRDRRRGWCRAAAPPRRARPPPSRRCRFGPAGTTP